MTLRQPKNSSVPLPYVFYFRPVLFCILIGLGSCVYLEIIHFKNYTDLDFASICAISKSINCDTVAQSPYSILLSLPVAIWGFFSFLLFGLLAVNTKSRKTMGLWWLIFYLGLAGSATSVYFGYVSEEKIHSYCLFCLLCYICFFIITFYSFIIIRRFKVPPGSLVKSTGDLFRSRGNLLFLALFLGSLALLQWRIPHYWEFPQHPPISKNVSTGRTASGAYWIGAEHPKLTIEEYADYMCFQCGKMDVFLRNLINSHPDKIRLVHHNYPLDNHFNPLLKHPFHVGAGKMALLALYAGSKGKFWEMNDELYRIVRSGKEHFNIQTLAERIGLPKEQISQAFTNPEYVRLLNDDIREGLKHRIISTPTFLINGNVYNGAIPSEILNSIDQ